MDSTDFNLIGLKMLQSGYCILNFKYRQNPTNNPIHAKGNFFLIEINKNAERETERVHEL